MPYKKDGTGIIYCLISPSGRRYIGQSWNFRSRMCSYRNMSTNLKTQIKLKRALEKYGFDSFEIEILDYCFNQVQMDDSEIYWINYFDVINTGYNCRIGGSRGRHTEEARKKISEANKNRSDEVKRKIIETRIRNGNLNPSDASKKKNRYSNAIYEYTITHPDGTTTITKSLNEFCEKHNLNKQSMKKLSAGKQRFYNGWEVVRNLLPGAKIREWSDEDKLKNSAKKKGKPRSNETIEKMKKAAKERFICDEHREILRQNGRNADHEAIGNKLRGRKLSKEQCRKMSESNKGRKPWNTGKKLSEEHKKKISDAQIGREEPMKGKHHTVESKKKQQDASCKYEYTLISPTGEKYITISLNEFCKEHGLIINCILVMLRGKQKQHKGWTATRKLREIKEKSPQHG